ncbi:MAG: ABC transporter ATP-binding protein [Candidatus Bathyarchaeia archaeon]
MHTYKLFIEHINVTYLTPTGENFTAVEDVTFGVEEGKFASIIGVSGCGKSTLLKAIMGLVPHRGKVYIDGNEVKAGQVAKECAMVFQMPTLQPWRKVIDNVTYGLEIRGVPKREAEKRAKEIIKLVGLSGFENYRPYQLSGGMQQRVNLARALAVNPSILLMDEPFGGLDAQTREYMGLELLRIWRETKKTILFVTHQIEEAVFLSDVVIALTARPSTVREIIDINLPRPREPSLMEDPTFLKYVSHLRRIIREEYNRAQNSS